MFHNGKNDIIKYVAVAVLAVIIVIVFLRISGSEEDGQQTSSFAVETTQSSASESTESSGFEVDTEAAGVSDATEVSSEDSEEAESEDSAEPEEEEYTFRNNKLLEEHYEKHGEEMGFKSAEDYEEAASEVVTNPEALHKTEKEDGDYCYYLEDTNEFVVVSTDGYIRTYFYPSSGKKYYDNQ